MRPVGPDVPEPFGVLLRSMQDAIIALQQPGQPQRMASVVLKADLPDAAKYAECAIICDEINSVVISTLVTGSYAWLRADGGAL